MLEESPTVFEIKALFIQNVLFLMVTLLCVCSPVICRVFGAFKNTNNRETVYAWFTFSHWLIYANSAANPIIYNFLSGEYLQKGLWYLTPFTSGSGVSPHCIFWVSSFFIHQIQIIILFAESCVNWSVCII